MSDMHIDTYIDENNNMYNLCDMCLILYNFYIYVVPNEYIICINDVTPHKIKASTMTTIIMCISQYSIVNIHQNYIIKLN